MAGEPPFPRYAKSVCDFLEDCDIGGFNVIGFDMPFVEAELRRAGVDFSRKGRQLVDPMVIFHWKEPRDLSAAYLRYCGKELESAHQAEADATASAEILDGQLETFRDLPRDVSGLCALCYEGRETYVDTEGRFVWAEEEAAFSFGKHSGRLLREVAEENPDYLQWILRQDFSPEVREIVSKSLRGEFPQRD